MTVGCRLAKCVLSTDRVCDGVIESLWVLLLPCCGINPVLVDFICFHLADSNCDFEFSVG